MEPPSLVDLALQQCLKLASHITDVGDANYHLVRPILSKASARQLRAIEAASPHILEHSQELWRVLISRDFPDRPIPKGDFRKGYYLLLQDKESQLGAARERLKRKQRQYEAEREASAIVPLAEAPRVRTSLASINSTATAFAARYKSSTMQHLAKQAHTHARTRVPRPPHTPAAIAVNEHKREAPFAPELKRAQTAPQPAQVSPQISPPPPRGNAAPASTAPSPARRKPTSIFIRRR